MVVLMIHSYEQLLAISSSKLSGNTIQKQMNCKSKNTKIGEMMIINVFKSFFINLILH